MNVFGEFLIVSACALGAGGVAYALAPRLQGRWTFSRRAADRVFGLFAGAYLVVFSYLSVVRYLAFKMGDVYINAGWDLGQYDQLICNSLAGRLLENTFVPDAPLFLGKSFTPILLALVPLYALWSDPVVLLVLQTVALCAAAFPLYWLARARVGATVAVCLAAAYFLSPALHYINLNEFHEIALAIPVLAYATFFLLRRHDAGFFATLGVALLIKEEIAFIVSAFGVFILLAQKRRALGLTLAVFGAAWAGVLLQYLIPFFQGNAAGGFYYFGNGVIAGGGARYGYLGRSLSEIGVTVLTRPDIVLAHLLVPGKIEFGLHLLAPLAFLPLVGADVLVLAAPTLGYTLLSEFDAQYSIRFSYSAALLVFFFFAALVGAERISKWGAARARWAMASGLLVASVLSYAWQSPAPLARYFQAERYVFDAHDALGNALMRTVPREATVATQVDFLAHLSCRQRVYEVPRLPDYRQADYWVADTQSAWYPVHQGYWDGFLASGYFEMATQVDGYRIAKRKTPTAPRIQFGESLTLLGSTIPLTDTVRGGMTIRPVVAWQVHVPLTERYAFAVQVVDAAEHVWAAQIGEPQDGRLPTTQWAVGKSIGDQYALNLPPTMPPGEYAITLAIRAATGDALGNEARIAGLRVEKNTASFTASELQIEQPLFVDLREMRFLGSSALPQSVRASDPVAIGLYWRAREKPRGDYVVAVQVRDASGRVAFEHAARPANGAYPTPLWAAGEVLLDWHDFVLPHNLAPGEYRIAIVLREASGAVIGETLISTLFVVN